MTRSIGRVISDKELRRAAQLIAEPALPPGLSDTIVNRRSRGERVALDPLRLPSPFGRTLRNIVYPLVAVAAALLVATAIRDRDRASAETRTASELFGMSDIETACSGFYTHDSPNVLKRLVNVILNVPARCRTQAFDAPPLAAIDASQIPVGTYFYTSESITDDAFTSRGRFGSSYTISQLAWHDQPALLAIRDGPLIERVSVDSLIVSVSSLHPLHSSSWYPTQHPIGSTRAEFSSDSIAIRMTGRFDTSGSFPYKHSLARLPHEWLSALVIPSLPLSPSWVGTVQFAPPFHPHAHQYFSTDWDSVSMKVVGQELVTVPAGTFRCWKLVANDSSAGPWIWVDVNHHFVVKSQSIARSASGKFDDRVELSRYTAPSR